MTWKNGWMKNKPLNIILDTNIFLVAVPDTSRYYWIYNNLLHQKFNLFISNDILKEYEEQLKFRYDEQTADEILIALFLLPNVFLVNIYYRWNLIYHDPDDNKFVDCAFAGNVDYIVTNDKHFNILQSVDFPKINVVKIDEFKKLFD
jgi:uncharacterized protein